MEGQRGRKAKNVWPVRDQGAGMGRRDRRRSAGRGACRCGARGAAIRAPQQRCVPRAPPPQKGLLRITRAASSPRADRACAGAMPPDRGAARAPAPRNAQCAPGLGRRAAAATRHSGFLLRLLITRAYRAAPAAEHFAAEANAKIGGGVDVRKSPKSMAKLMKQCKRTKEILSANAEAPISVESIHGEVDFRSSITRGARPVPAAFCVARSVGQWGALQRWGLMRPFKSNA